ncbi:MAG: nucleotide sugar dehydrogenase [Gammaproteobacteria bacterium]
MEKMTDEKICVIGLGYVGLPLAAALAKHFFVVGCDRDSARISALRNGGDDTGELSADELRGAEIRFTSDISDAAGCTVFVITVPTPLLPDNRPDLSPLTDACRAVGKMLPRGGLAIVESTVYPGVTEEVCAPILAEVSGLEYNRDFFCGYSPERANPGDAARPLSAIQKVTAGSTPEAAARTDDIYRKIIAAGTHRAPSVRVAEASKVIENTQRDVNIALMNEFAMLCRSMDLDSAEVFAAAAGKWNFLPFVPGLVGGHCIGVDPYYLCHKAQTSGYQPNLILAARQINDSMGKYVADAAIYEMARRGVKIKGARVLILGFSFKENCPDPRNSRVSEMRRILRNAGAEVCVCDPVADAAKTRAEYGMELSRDWRRALAQKPAAVVFAVAHREFSEISAADLGDALVLDVKGCAPRADWRL